MNSLAPNLMVYNVDDTVEYYKSYFNFDLVASEPQKGDLQWAMIKNGDVTLMLQDIDRLRNDLPYFEDIEPGGGFTLFIQVDEVEKLYDKIKDDIEVISDLNITFYGMNEFTIRDLNGYVLTFAERIEE
jgi:uncharacterized glyoxalase superfamily protein PhnB